MLISKGTVVLVFMAIQLMGLANSVYHRRTSYVALHNLGMSTNELGSIELDITPLRLQ